MPARHIILLWTIALLACSSVVTAQELTLTDVQRVFPTARSITPLNGKVPAYMVRDVYAYIGDRRCLVLFRRT